MVHPTRIPRLVRSLLAGLALAPIIACGGDKDLSPVLFTNGFDFAVTAQITGPDGDESTVEIPAQGRVEADLEGKHTVKYLTPGGEVMANKTYKLPAGDERKERCQSVLNVLGSAAIVEEDVAYGVRPKSSGKMLSGSTWVTVCPRWGFETTSPPEEVTVEEGTQGISLTWLHYKGEGDWVAAIEHRLAQEPAIDDSHRIKAWNIAIAVKKFDSDNPRLAPLGPKFLAACDTIVETVTSGPLAGKKAKDCVSNTKALFPDA